MNLKTGIPEYSIEAELAIPVLYSTYTDIIFYVEDTDRVNIYETILSRVLNRDIDFNCIRPTGGKKKMKQIFGSANDEFFNTCFFIADLDFDEFLDAEMINHPNFIYLKRYSIENYLVDENVGIEFLNGRLGVGKVKCRETIKFNEWLSEVQTLYKPLIILFVLAQKLELGIPNAKSRAEEYITNNSWRIDRKKIRNYFNQVVKKSQENQSQNIIPLMFSINREILKKYPKDYWKMIPGKQLITIFIRYLVSYTKNKQHILDDFIHQAAKDCSISELEYIKERIEYVLSMRRRSDEECLNEQKYEISNIRYRESS